MGGIHTLFLLSIKEQFYKKTTFKKLCVIKFYYAKCAMNIMDLQNIRQCATIEKAGKFSVKSHDFLNQNSNVSVLQHRQVKSFWFHSIIESNVFRDIIELQITPLKIPCEGFTPFDSAKILKELGTSSWGLMDKAQSFIFSNMLNHFRSYLFTESNG